MIDEITIQQRFEQKQAEHEAERQLRDKIRIALEAADELEVRQAFREMPFFTRNDAAAIIVEYASPAYLKHLAKMFLEKDEG